MAKTENQRRFEETFTSWAHKQPPGMSEEFVAAVRDRAQEDFARQLDANPHSHQDVFAGLGDSFALASVRQSAIDHGSARFDTVFKAWQRRLTNTNEPLPWEFTLSPEALGRVHDHMRTVWERHMQASVHELFATSRDVHGDFSGRLQQAQQRLEELTRGFHHSLDLRADYEIAMAPVHQTFEHMRQSWRDHLNESDRALLAELGVPQDATLSKPAVDLLNAHHRDQFDTHFAEAFGSTDSAGQFRGDPQGKVEQWQQRVDALTGDLPHQFAHQAAREAVITKVAAAVDEAAGSWHEALSRLGPEFTTQFGLAHHELSPASLNGIKQHLARTIDEQLHAELGGRPSPDTTSGTRPQWPDTLAELTNNTRLQEDIAVHVAARESVSRTARTHATNELLSGNYPRLSGDASERVRTSYEQRATAAFDTAFPTAFGQPRELHEQLAHWQQLHRELSQDLPAHILFEAHAHPALTKAAAHFAATSNNRKIDQPTLDGIAESYRTDWFTHYHHIWGPHNLHPDTWLDHEAAHENTFHTARRPPTTSHTPPNQTGLALTHQSNNLVSGHPPATPPSGHFPHRPSRDAFPALGKGAAVRRGPAAVAVVRDDMGKNQVFQRSVTEVSPPAGHGESQHASLVAGHERDTTAGDQQRSRIAADTAGREAVSTDTGRGGGRVVGAGEVDTDQWLPFKTHRAVGMNEHEVDAGESFRFLVGDDGQRLVVRPMGSGQRTQVRYAWTWHEPHDGAPPLVRMTQRVHLNARGVNDDDLKYVREQIATGLRKLNALGHHLPPLQPDVRLASHSVEQGGEPAGPVLHVAVEFVNDPAQAHLAVTVHPGPPTEQQRMDQHTWYAGMDPSAYVHELIHGLGVRDDHPDPRVLLTPEGHPPRPQPDQQNSVMGARSRDTVGPSGDHGTAGYSLTNNHLHQIADQFAPYAHPTAISTTQHGRVFHTTHPPIGIDLSPAMPSWKKMFSRGKESGLPQPSSSALFQHLPPAPPSPVGYHYSFNNRAPDSYPYRPRDGDFHRPSIHQDAPGQFPLEWFFPGLRELNNTRDMTNCNQAIVSVDRMMSGQYRPIPSTAIGDWGVNRLKAEYNGRWLPVSSYDDIIKHMHEWPGSRGVVNYQDLRLRWGHYINVAHIGDDVVFIDGQKGDLAHLDTDITDIALMRYHPSDFQTVTPPFPAPPAPREDAGTSFQAGQREVVPLAPEPRWELPAAAREFEELVGTGATAGAARPAGLQGGTGSHRSDTVLLPHDNSTASANHSAGAPVDHTTTPTDAAPPPHSSRTSDASSPARAELKTEQPNSPVSDSVYQQLTTPDTRTEKRLLYGGNETSRHSRGERHSRRERRRQHAQPSAYVFQVPPVLPHQAVYQVPHQAVYEVPPRVVYQVPPRVVYQVPPQQRVHQVPVVLHQPAPVYPVHPVPHQQLPLAPPSPDWAHHSFNDRLPPEYPYRGGHHDFRRPSIHREARGNFPLEHFFPGLGELNISRSGNNCNQAIVSVDRMMNGLYRPIPWDVNGNHGLNRLKVEYNGRWREVRTYDDIIEWMDARPGSRGLVGIRRLNGLAHVFNVAHIGHDVVFVDGQEGDLAWLRTDLERIAFMQYNPRDFRPVSPT